jgi:hypothetical protein
MRAISFRIAFCLIPITNEPLEIPASHEVHYKLCKKNVYMSTDTHVEAVKNVVLIIDKFSLQSVLMEIVHRNVSPNFVTTLNSCNHRRTG